MSDRLPSRRRRSSGGRHVAPRPQPAILSRALGATRVPTRVAQGGVALGLVLSMGAVVVTADGEETTPLASVVDDGESQARAAAARAEMAARTELRTQAVVAAQAAVHEVSRVRSDAAQAAVPEDVLAELDAATAALEEAIARIDVPPVVERRPNVSRSTDRDALVTPDTTTAATPAATAAAEEPSPAPAATDAPADAPAATDPSTTTDDVAAAAPVAEVLADVTLPDTSDPATTPLRVALDRVKQAAQVVVTTTEQKKAEAAAAQAAAEEAARVAAAKAAQRAAWKASLQGFGNGQVPDSALCGVSFDPRALLRCDAAESLDALNTAFVARFGTPLHVSDSYRSYGAQVTCRANKGRLCAAPGTSNHGMGVAVDLGGSVQSFGTAQHQWMRENAPTYDWTLPEWARAGGSKPEPWHWEYVG